MSSDSVRATALKLFRMLNGGGDGGSEFEFNCLSNQKEWLHLAKYCIRLEAEGERRGRIAGLRMAADLCGGDSHIEEGILAEADRLEKEKEKKSPVDKSNVKE